MENSRDYKVNRYFFLAIIIALAIFLIFSLIQFFTAFLLAIIFYILGKPLCDWLVKKTKMEKKHGSIAFNRGIIFYYPAARYRFCVAAL
jgi:predicted PurR-regulated permease PerM